MNESIISGRVTREPKLAKTNKGVPACFFSVAVDRPGDCRVKDFIDCVAWGKNATFVHENFHKADPIEVSGAMTTRNYDDAKGRHCKSYKLSCERINFVKRPLSCTKRALSYKVNL